MEDMKEDQAVVAAGSVKAGVGQSSTPWISLPLSHLIPRGSLSIKHMLDSEDG